jgi:hypothetical protein
MNRAGSSKDFKIPSRYLMKKGNRLLMCFSRLGRFLHGSVLHFQLMCSLPSNDNVADIHAVVKFAIPDSFILQMFYD